MSAPFVIPASQRAHAAAWASGYREGAIRQAIISLEYGQIERALETLRGAVEYVIEQEQAA